MEPTASPQGQTVGERTAANVRAELGRRRLSGRDLARACKWPATSTWRRLAGEVVMTVDEIVTVADFLGVPVMDLMGVDDRRNVAASA